MNKTLLITLLLSISLMMLGCKSLSQNIKDTKSNLVGTNIDALFSQWGVPTSSVTMKSSNGTVHTWDQGGCKNNVTADSAGTITEYTATGNCHWIQR